MSLDIALAQKAGEMSSADVRLVSRERIKKQRHRNQQAVGNTIDSGMDLSITIDKLRVFINKTLSILSAYQ
jgi:hypothetical protein